MVKKITINNFLEKFRNDFVTSYLKSADNRYIAKHPEAYEEVCSRQNFIKLIKEEKLYNYKDKYEQTPLFTAITLKDIDLVINLVENGANINVISKHRGSVLNYASVINVQIANYLIKCGAEFKNKDEAIQCLTLYLSSKKQRGHGHQYVDLILKRYNIDIDTIVQEEPYSNDKNITLLGLAVKNNNKDISKYLLNNGADVNIKNYKGETPIITIFRNINKTQANTALLKTILKYTQNKIIYDKIKLRNIIDTNNYNVFYPLKIFAEYGIDLRECVYGAVTKYEIENMKDIENKLKIYLKNYFILKLELLSNEEINNYLDVFETILYDKNMGIDEIKANIDMFYFALFNRIEKYIINEDLEI